jgi:PAS domain S-box-containing protein
MTKKTNHSMQIKNQKTILKDEMWERTFDAVPDLIMILDNQHKILKTNRAMTERLGKSSKDLVGSKCYEVVHGTLHPPEFCPHMNLIKDGKEHSVETNEVRLGGDFLITVSPIYDSERKIIGSVHVARDIRELKRLEKQLKSAQEALEHKVKMRTEELVAAKEQLLKEIEERKRAEQSLIEAELRYRTVADFTYDWVYWQGADGTLIYVSPSCERITEYRAENFIKDPTLLKKIIVKEDQKLWLKHHTGKKGYAPHELQFRIRTRNGEERWIEHVCQPVIDDNGRFLGYRASNRDITHRKKIEEELEIKKQSLAEAQRIARLGNWDWNIVTNELYWSDEIYRIFGLKSQEFGATYEAFLDFVHPDDRPLVESSVDAALQENKPYSIDHRIALPDGSERIVHEQAEVMRDETGQAIKMAGTVQDITERKKAEEDRRQLREELTHVSRVTTIGTLAGALAHEINQPLTAIMSNAQAAKRFLDAEKPNLDELREILTDIVDDTSRSSDVVHQLRDFMKKGEIEEIPLNINKTIQEVVNLTQRDAENRNIAIKLETSENLPEVMGDKVQLQQVVLNLVINGFDAMMYQDPTSRELSIQTEQDEENNIHVAVSDTGIGIEQDRLDQIFEPFFSTKSEGMGLGLSINRYIINAHNGHMWATNNPKYGATVHFTLPIKK